MTAIAPHVSAFLPDHLPNARGAGPHTVKSCARAIRLFVTFAGRRPGQRPALIDIRQLDAQLALDWPGHLENSRANSAASRNARLAAVKPLFRYIGMRMPESLDLSRQIHAIPAKRCADRLAGWLERDELEALPGAPRPRPAQRPAGSRHDASGLFLRPPGLGADLADAVQPQLAGSAERPDHGKGTARKSDAAVAGNPGDSLQLDRRPASGRTPRPVPDARGGIMTRHGFASRLAVHAAAAARKCPSLAGRNVTPHTLRHTCAVHVLQATGDIRKVSLWPGHAPVTSTEVCLRAFPDEKLSILNSVQAPGLEKGKFGSPGDLLVSLLDSLRAGPA